MLNDVQIEIMNEILSNFFVVVPDTLGLVLSNKKGEILYSNFKSDDNHNRSINNSKLGEFNADITPLLEKLQTHFSKEKKYASSVIETDQFRLLNVLISDLFYSFFLDVYASLSVTYPYAYLAVEKMHQLLVERKKPQTKVPKLGNVKGSELETPQFNEEKNWNFKYIILGDPGVGKTTMTNRFIHNTYNNDYRPTIGLNIMTYEQEFMDYTISMSIWDLGSQKMFQRVRKEYYMGAHVGVLVFDLSRRSTLESLGSWVGELKQFAGEDVAFIVVGNKSDLDHEISFEEATKEAKKWGAGYIETSALEGDNVEDAFNLCSYELINKYKSRNI